MANPDYDYIHAINCLKGWPMAQPLDIPITVASSDAAYAVEGRIAALTTGGTYQYPACKLGSAGVQLPMILHRSGTSYDVSNAGGTITTGVTVGTFGWVAGIPDGTMGALVLTSPLEIETTEFDTSVTSYNPLAPLKSPTVAVAGANGGLLYTERNWSGGGGAAIAYGTDTLVGFVSRGNTVNNYGVPVLAFWPNPQYVIGG